ncbi:L-type lectin-domain containing receptor kinase IX.1-like [Pistacia vera]|uniref:L-type lectin-domain containing receptor kinase IX.1-like n=1 Tax=Pistacia vera TaxID=55513 RepID=UPI00126316FD|nr:L-type lectin-domain containing receptor kinase IX.1-like [Pistacia vera]
MATSFYNLLSSSLLFFFLLFLFVPSANSVSFKLTRFDSENTYIFYEGDAKASVGAVEFNSLSYLCRVGRAAYAENVRLWDSHSNELSDFTSHFSFSIDTKGSEFYGAGFAFYLAPVGFQIPPNSAGGFLGLFNTTTSDSSHNQIVLVEFDSFANPEWDPPVPHVGINTNSISSAVYTPWNASIHSDDTADVRITYNATTKNMSVSWTYWKTNGSLENSTLSYQIDLMKVLPEWVSVGFSAATGMYVERHQLFSWEFYSSLDTEESNEKKSEMIKLEVSIAVLVGVLIAGAVLTFCIWWRRKYIQKEEEEINLASMNDDLERGAGPKRFSYKDLRSATKNFSKDRKLGEGGFGAVYKGYIIDLDMPVAVKKISSGSKQGRKEYITEVKIISRLRHRNLVQLIGWCHDRGEFLLVYEFLTNGSLDSHLFGKKSPLTWAVRYKMAFGLASVVLYLHEEWEQCVVHRDIKSSNVMLDSSFNVKLGDFGLARLMDHELGPQTATGLAGTLGYMAPEYISTGRSSKESDVYSFGVVALEIATGRKAIDPLEQKSQTTLVQWIWELYGEGDFLSAVDERLHTFDETQAECLMIVGLWCAHPDSSLRPTIRKAIQVLNFEAPLPNLPEKMPVPVYQIPTTSFASTEPSITVSSLDTGR